MSRNIVKHIRENSEAGMEYMNYHERLKGLQQYCKDRRERYKIIFACQQAVGVRESVLEIGSLSRGKTQD